MDQFSSNFFLLATAMRSAGFCAFAFGLAACGGKGDRLTANVQSEIDAGREVDPYNLTATLELAQFGCTPGQPLPGDRGQITQCLDWENGPPTGGFLYADTIVPASLGAWTIPNSNALYSATLTDSNGHGGPGTNAFHFTAFSELVWGPQFGAQFLSSVIGARTDGPLLPVDVTNWEGVSFWIRQGDDRPDLEPTGTSLFVSLRDPDTMSLEQDGVLCNDKSNFDSEKCDPYGTAVGFDRTWRYVMLPFDEMKQRGYGVPEAALNRKQIMKITFSMDLGDGANGNWNLWVDDIMLYRYKN